MLYYLSSHLIQIILLPPGVNLLLFLLGWLLWRHFRLLAKTLIGVSFFSLWLLSTPKISLLLINRLQDKYPVLELSSKLPTIDSAIVVLGGGDEAAPEYNNALVPGFETINRMLYVDYLYQYLKIPIIASGASLNKSTLSGGKLICFYFKKHFHITSCYTTNKGKSTIDESKYLIPLLFEKNIKTIYLVTNAWHMPRSMYVISKASKETNLRVIPSPTGFLMIGDQAPILNYLPTLKGLRISFFALREYLGFVCYKLFMS